MPSAFDSLIGRVTDEHLRAELQAAAADLRKITDFGLVFEAHLPETVRLPHHTIRRGIKVTHRDSTDQSIFDVVGVDEGTITIRRLRHPDGTALSQQEASEVGDENAALDSLVAVAEFGDPIYPGLRPLGTIDKGGDRPAHVVIKGENHHVLEALEFTHAGKVDCIYIDPPYNSGARDWKYNNDYVDADDAYRHSKWLAFMARRLRLAKQLLNPSGSVLICTIDEREVHRLALLLEQIFRGCRIQMVSITISPRGTSRANEFSRVDEFALFVFVGQARLGAANDIADEQAEARWQYLRRDERTSTRASGRPNQFYPVYVNTTTRRIEGVGDPLARGADRSSVAEVEGCAAVFPVRADGTEMVWGVTAPSLRKIAARGFVRVTPGVHEHQPYTITYLRGVAKNIESGKYRVVGERDDESKIVVVPGGKVSKPTTVWRDKAHDAGAYGTSVLGALIPGRHFPFPKSLYAVEDAIRPFVTDKPDAVILDFFGGSGTTAHAVARLNRQDGGRRRSVVVTNNEVSEIEAHALRSEGFRPGDPEWEALGIFEHVTRPRITAAVTGLTPVGEPVGGDYKFNDEFPMSEGFEENVEFFELTYLDAARVEVDLAFAGVAPLLWLRAGARGPLIEDCVDAAGRSRPYTWTYEYGVLFNTDRWRSFVTKLPDTATTVYIVTDSTTAFAHIAGELPGHLDVVRLYERYLTTFALNGR